MIPKKYFIVIAFLALIILCLKCMYQHSRTVYELAIALGHVEIICESENVALKSEPKEAIKRLNYIVNYYPAGTRLRKGGRAEKIVEIVRNQAEKNIILHLKRITGKDYGDEPEIWIEKMGDNK